ncbi:MAG TPA: coproporphyrinogen III oxidase family protein [Candidatus Pacearchaeota archaeon]|nr:coproporphyrinogen III oxidase family protein [Candidatus Pacearchaeota archaeon]
MGNASRIDEIRSRLREQLVEEPGIMSFAYPYVRFWNELEEDEVKQSWTSFSGDSPEGILYVHMPFCLSKCGYCDYATNFGVENRHGEYKSYVDAVEGEVGLLMPFTRGLEFSAVYFGGGTPTIFCSKGLERIIDITTSNFSLSDSAEISIEVYPSKKMLRDKLGMLRDVGVNRVSIGIQDFNDEVIAFTGRRYTGEEASRIVREAENLFDTVNIDLICGLPKQEKWRQTLEQTLALEPQQITIQPFSNRHLGIRFHHPKYSSLLPNLDQVVEMYDLARHMLGKKGYTQTSRHQFTKGVEHQYEQKISQSVARLGIGAHSISLLPELTYKNFTSLREYQEAVSKGVLPIERGFRITNDEAMRSYLFYSLSADCGGLSLSEGEARERFGTRIQDAFPDEVQALERENLIEVGEDKIDLTPKGVYFTSLLQRTFYNPSFLK